MRKWVRRKQNVKVKVIGLRVEWSTCSKAIAASDFFPSEYKRGFFIISSLIVRVALTHFDKCVRSGYSGCDSICGNETSKKKIKKNLEDTWLFVYFESCIRTSFTHQTEPISHPWFSSVSPDVCLDRFSKTHVTRRIICISVRFKWPFVQTFVLFLLLCVYNCFAASNLAGRGGRVCSRWLFRCGFLWCC